MNEKKIKTLVPILTSYHISLLRRCYESIKRQYEVKFEYDIIIVVNTLKEGYIKEVKEEFKEEIKEGKIEVIETESNGWPGKGHNSLYKIFKERKEYDYMLNIDGDDMFYPCAFQQYEKLLEYKPDIIHLMLNDYITYIYKEKIRHVNLKGEFKLYSSFGDERNWWKQLPVENPFSEDIHKCKTPSRILISSRNVVDKELTYPIEFSEKLTLYDDYIAFLSFCEAHYRKELKVYAISNSNIYLYNAVNDESMSRKFKEIEYEKKIFIEEREKYINIKNNWKLGELPYINISHPEKFTLDDKVNYCNKYVCDFEINEKFKLAINALKENKKEESIKWFETLLKYGILNSYFIYLNLGILHYQRKEIYFATIYFELASIIRPCYEIFKNLFFISYEKEEYQKALYYGNNAKKCNIKKDELDNLLEKIKEKINIRIYNKNKFNLCLENNSNNNINKLKKKPILCYYVGYSEPFNGKNIEERNVWGSELSAVKVCEGLSKWYECHIFCVCKPDEQIIHNNVYYHHISLYNKFQKEFEIEVLLVSRFVHFFLENTILAKNTYFLLHDARVHNFWLSEQLPDYGNAFFKNILHNIKKIICVSDWQIENYCRFSGLNKDLMYVIPNGYNPKNFENKNYKKIKNRFIYSSDPQRGLLPLCEIFPKIREKIPDATLDIYFAKIDNIKILNIINKYDYINFHGKLTNKDLSIELMKSDVWFYPNFYSHETFCMSALEALAAGTLVITRNFSGIKDTVGEGGILINGKGDEFMDIALKKIIEILNNNKLKKEYQAKAKIQAAKYKWSNIIERWYNFLKK